MIYCTFFASGDLTEDPNHPKSIWPSDILCPECRPHPWNVLSSQRNMMKTIDGILWNYEATSNYLMKLYANDKIVGITIPSDIHQNMDTVKDNNSQLKLGPQTISQNIISRLHRKLK